MRSRQEMLRKMDSKTSAKLLTFFFWYFVDISSRHIEGNRLDKTVWNLLNFNANVRYHVKVTITTIILFHKDYFQLKTTFFLTYSTDICTTEHQRFHSEKDEETFGKSG